MNLGFTGTRDGLVVAQRHRLRLLIAEYVSQYDTVYWHEGEGLDRSGGPHSADLEAKALAEAAGCVIVPHPPADETAEAMLARNREIVAASQFMLAAPGGYREEVRSGTWMTVRHARSRNVPGSICWPCGCTTPISEREHARD